MAIEIALSGFLFLFVIITITASSQLGNKITFGETDLDSDTLLQSIIDDPKRFRMSVYLALIEHGSIIALAIVLFVAFGSYNLVLGSIWVVARTVEGLILFVNEKNYWGLLNLAGRYSATSGDEKSVVSDLGLSTLRTKHHRFSFAQILFSIGTLGYTILFVTYGVVPAIIGWFGLVSGIIYGLGNVITATKPENRVLAMLGGLMIFLFEAVLGIWLLYSSFIIP
ncbi:MAG: DUF4386 domain-containing protein [Candidatus Thorarchaeota archaeon]|nr:MAG: DUF4386 domain-containing protein [Candidatus Thorarchaeota archaeon]